MDLNGEIQPGGEIPLVLPDEFPVNNTTENIVHNILTNAARGLPTISQREMQSQVPLIIVCGGPSLKEYLPQLKIMAKSANVMAVNGAYGFLLENGIEPEWFLLVDSREENLPIVDRVCDETHHILASQVHPKVFEALADQKVHIVHIGTPKTIETLGKDVEYLKTPLGHAGIHAIYVGFALGYQKHVLFGYDCSHARYHHAFSQPLNDKDDTIEVVYKGVHFKTTPGLAQVATNFQRVVTPLMNVGLELEMCADGLLPFILRSQE